MTDALSLDLETVAVQCAEAKPPRDPWLQRRDHTWGASDVPALLLAYDPRPDEFLSALNHHKEAAAHAVQRKISRGFPLCVERKAMNRDKKPSASMAFGKQQEALLFEKWRERCGSAFSGYFPASVLPIELMPFVDRECPHLAVTPDAFCRRKSDSGFVTAELKCSYEEDAPEWHWYHDAQLQAQMGACSAVHGMLVLGPGWANPKRELFALPRFREVARDDEAIARIRYACARGWADVLKVRERMVS